MKKVTAIFFLFCILINTGGYQLIPIIYRVVLKAEMKQYVIDNPNSELKTIFHFQTANSIITDPLFVWEEEDVEFEYNGKMYDVVSVESDKNNVTLFCIDDLEETNISEIEDKINKTKNQESEQSESNAQKLLFTSFDIPVNIVSIVPLINSKEICNYKANSILFRSIENIYSPPEINTLYII